MRIYHLFCFVLGAGNGFSYPSPQAFYGTWRELEINGHLSPPVGQCTRTSRTYCAHILLRLCSYSVKIGSRNEPVFYLYECKPFRSEVHIGRGWRNTRVGVLLMFCQVIEEGLSKLQLLEACASEFNATRSYLDRRTSMAWGQYRLGLAVHLFFCMIIILVACIDSSLISFHVIVNSEENFDVTRARKILDEDRYGLTDMKERIMGVHRCRKAELNCSGYPRFFAVCTRRSVSSVLLFC